MGRLKDAIFLSAEQYNTLKTTGSIVISGVTYTYDEDNLYMVKKETYTKAEMNTALATKQNVTDSTLKTSSKTVVGAINELKTSVRAIKSTLDATCIVNTDYFLGEQATVSIVLPSTHSIGDSITVSFYSGATATSLSVSGSTIGTIPTPETDQRIELCIIWDGTNWVVKSDVIDLSE